MTPPDARLARRAGRCCALLIVGGLLAACTATQRPAPALPAVSAVPPFPTIAPSASVFVSASTPTPTPLVMRGAGKTATPAFALPAPIGIAHFTHEGRSKFVVQSFVGGQGDLLIDTIGAYEGSRPLLEGSPVQLNIDADGPWTVTVTAMTCCAASGAFAGRGDAVSSQFNPPARGVWDFSNGGPGNYAAFAHCATGDQLVLRRVGSFQGSTTVVFGRGPCYWEVISDGSWSIKPS